MQTVKTKTIQHQNFSVSSANIIEELRFISESEKEFSLGAYIQYLLKAAESSDAVLRAEIENNILKQGEKALPYLVNSLLNIKGTARGMAAMTIVRIGMPAVEILEAKAAETPDFAWIAEYLKFEILGTQVSV